MQLNSVVKRTTADAKHLARHLACKLRAALMASKDLHVESSDSTIQAEDYVIVHGYRFVRPYHFDFMCNVRQRWFGGNIVDIMSKVRVYQYVHLGR